MVIMLVGIMIVIYKSSLCNNICDNKKIIMLSACIVAAIVSFLYYVNRSVYGNYFMSQTNAVLEYVKEEIPANTLGIGMGITEMYSF